MPGARITTLEKTLHQSFPLHQSWTMGLGNEPAGLAQFVDKGRTLIPDGGGTIPKFPAIIFPCIQTHGIMLSQILIDFPFILQ